ncbi:unannotated protein [freshwater metagenome]|uniref:[acyl-carrier-protein] S-malonyltransferase n=1 Tax=freshwater metagenome TaxID=449393 RepID=A0A6J7Y0T5_9ZZZZ
MLALLAPGQGSQTPGMLTTWLENPELKDLLKEWSQAIDLDLIHLGTSASAEEIQDTANAQPLIVAASLLSAHALLKGNMTCKVIAGHSVGEISAAAIAGVISSIDAMKLVRTRGIEMAKAASLAPAGMSAVLGGIRVEVLEAIALLGLVAANDNGAGQIVAAGSLEALEKLANHTPAGARVRPLAVAGAFHTSYMSPAVQPMQLLAQGIEVSNPLCDVISNKDGEIVSDGREILDRIVNQIANPVRWDLCMSAMKSHGITGAIELAPGGTLVGLLKRAEPEIQTCALKSSEDLSTAAQLITNHG